MIGTYGGEPVQWESRQQAFCTLSSAEAELLGYTEAMTMGDSLAALTNVLEGTGDETGTECRLGGTTKLVFESWKRQMDLGEHATFAFELMHYESGSNGALGR